MDIIVLAVFLFALPLTGGLPESDGIYPRTTTCLQQILPGADVEDMASNPLPNWKLYQFKNVCGQKKGFDLCMKAIPKNSGERSLEILKELLQKKMDFLCGFGSDEYIHHKDCLFKNDVGKKVTVCSNEFGKNYENAKKNKSLECDVISTFRECVKNSAQICGLKAKFLVATYMDFNVESYTGAPKCLDSFNGVTINRFTLLNMMLPVMALWIKTS